MSVTPAPNIYDFKDPADYLRACFQFQKSQDPDLTTRKWAHVLGLKSAEVLFSLLKSKKRLSPALLDLLAKHLRLDSSERAYFEALVKYSEAETSREKSVLELVLAELRGLRGEKVFVEDLNVFSHWIHMAILSMSKLKGFHCSKETIGDLLREEMHQEVIDKAVDCLLKLGLVTYDEKGSLVKKYDHTTSRNDASKKVEHSYFHQVSDLAKQGVEVPAEEREYQCFSVALKHEHIPLFKETIRQFRAKIGNLAKQDDVDQVYQLNVQFFPLTKAPVGENGWLHGRDMGEKENHHA